MRQAWYTNTESHVPALQLVYVIFWTTFIQSNRIQCFCKKSSLKAKQSEGTKKKNLSRVWVLVSCFVLTCRVVHWNILKSSLCGYLFSFLQLQDCRGSSSFSIAYKIRQRKCRRILIWLFYQILKTALILFVSKSSEQIPEFL